MTKSKRMFVIHKNTRIPTDVSYSGPTWDKANIRHLYKPQYDDEKHAEMLAMCLTYENMVGFSVSEI
jgi:hypothetical protein